MLLGPQRRSDAPCQARTSRQTLSVVLLRCSSSLSRTHHSRRSSQQQAEVRSEAPVPDITDVELEHLTRAQRVATVDLPQTRHAGGQLVALGVALGKREEVLRGVRPRSDQGHLAEDDVPELGELIDAVP